MRSNRRVTTTVVVLVVLLIIGMLISKHIHKRNSDETTHRVLSSAIADVQSVVRVTSLEGIRSVPVKYEKDGTGAFGVGTYRFRISYDVENMDAYVQGDSIIVRLPKEKVTILEDEHQGFRVLDVWGTNIFSRFSGPRLTIANENMMRSTAMAQVKSDLKNEGIISQARSHAMSIISNMLSLVPGTVIVLGPDDPLPGSINDKTVCPNPELSLPNPESTLRYS